MAGVISLDATDRTALEDEATLILKHRHWLLYGISDVDTCFIHSLSDRELADIVERDRQLREVGY